MNYVIKTAKTVEEAVRQALKELNVNRYQVEIEVIEESSKGFLGIIGSKDATVKVSKIEDTQDILNEIFNSNSEKSQNSLKKDEFEYNAQAQDINENFDNELEVENLHADKKEKISDIETKNTSAEINYENLTREFMEKVLNSLDIDYSLDISKKDNILNVNISGDEEKLGIVIGKRGVTLDSIQYILSLIINKNSEEYIRVIVDSSGYREKRQKTLKELAEKMAAKVLKTNRSIRLEPMNSVDRKIIHESLQDYEGVITHSEGRDPFRKVVIQKERKY